MAHVHADGLVCSLQGAQATRRGETLHKQKGEERQYPKAAAERGSKESREKALCKRRHRSHVFPEQRKAHLWRAAYGREHVAWHCHTQAALLSQGCYRSVAQKGYFQRQGHIHVGILVLELLPRGFCTWVTKGFTKPMRFCSAHRQNPLCRLKPTSPTCPAPSSLPIPMGQKDQRQNQPKLNPSLMFIG